MKTAQRIAMRAKAKNRWSHDTMPEDDADEALAWHEERHGVSIESQVWVRNHTETVEKSEKSDEPV